MSEIEITIEIVDILGTGECSIGQKVGDVFNYPEDRGRMCPNSFHILYPWLLSMQSGGTFSFFDDGGDSMTLGCSSYQHQVVYKVSRRTVEETGKEKT